MMAVALILAIEGFLASSSLTRKIPRPMNSGVALHVSFSLGGFAAAAKGAGVRFRRIDRRRGK